VIPSIAAGRQLSVRTARWQSVCVAVVALAWLVKGAPWALAAALAGAAVVLGSWLAARVALGGGAGPAGMALMRMLLGLGLKWGLVVVTLAISLRAGLPALALLAGAVAAVLTQVLVMLGQASSHQHHPSLHGR